MGHTSDYNKKLIKDGKFFNPTPNAVFHPDFFRERAQELMEEADKYQKPSRLLLETAKINLKIAEVLTSKN